MGAYLVLLDGSAFAERALPYASALAGLAEDELILVRVAPAVARVYATGAPGRDLAVGPPGEPSARGYLEAVAAKLRATGIRATPRAVPLQDAARAEQVAAAVAATAAAVGARGVVMTTHGRSGLGRLLYGSVAEAVLRSATTPVLCVPPGAGATWADREPRRVLVPDDGSAVAGAALGPAVELAGLLRAEVLLLRVVEPPDREYRFAAHRALEEQVDAGPELRGVAVQTRVEVGEPAATIAAVADEAAPLAIVMATHGRAGLARLTMGSVAAGVLPRARVPLLLVPPGAAKGRPGPAPQAEPEWLTR
jgi:nucleotide-binding universal stress UspA family protein